MKVQTRILLSFAVVLLLFFGIGFRIMDRYRQADSAYRTEIMYTIGALIAIEASYDEYAEIRVMSNRYWMHLGDSEFFDLQASLVNERVRNIHEFLGRFEVWVTQHGRIAEKGPHIENLRQSITRYQELNLALIDVARTGDVNAYVQAFTVFLNDTTYMDFLISIEYLLDASRREMVAMVDVFTARTQFDLILAIVSFLVIGLVCVVISIGLARPIKTSLNKLMDSATQIARGDLSMSLANNGKDEFSVLLNSFAKTIDVLQGSINDIVLACRKYNIEGDIDYRIDASKYENSFNAIMQGVNDIIDGSVKDISTAINVTNQISDGNFDVAIADMPGKKIILPKSLRAITSNLQRLYESINYLTQSASDGKLDVGIDAESFKGNWGRLANELNGLVVAVAKPLSAIEASLVEMQKGNFAGARITGEYKGIFDTVKTALNTTEAITLSYIEEIADTLSFVSKGDLTVTISREYIGSYAPIKEALHIILDSLNHTMSEITQATEQVVSGSEQIAQNAMQLADGATKQNHAIQELSEAVEVIHTKANQASTNANDANERAVRSEESAQVGGVAVQSLTDNMATIKKSSESISKIMGVINDIAFQTNLLALNAAVEAARAGEHGKGFSVVAEEVRTLAGRSQQSVGDTAAIIDEDTQSVGKGLKATGEVVESFDTIRRDISQISGIVSQITSLSGEQLESIANVNSNVSEIARVVTNNSATAEESAAASQELNAQAEMLKKMLSFFKLRK